MRRLSTTRLILILSLVAGTVVFAPVVRADSGPDVITNGTFAVPSMTGAATTLFAGDSTSMPGWTVNSGSIDVIAPTYWPASPGGGNSIDMNGASAGSISQSIMTLPGATYTLSFYLAANPDASTNPQVLVSFGGYSQVYTFIMPCCGWTGSMGWQLITINDIPIDSSLATLTFTSLTSGNAGAAISDVTMYDAPPPSVPEPSTLVLMGSGLCGLGVVRRKLLS